MCKKSFVKHKKKFLLLSTILLSVIIKKLKNVFSVLILQVLQIEDLVADIYYEKTNHRRKSHLLLY